MKKIIVVILMLLLSIPGFGSGKKQHKSSRRKCRAHRRSREKITRIINGGDKGFAERKQFKREITEALIELYGSCSA